MTESSKYSINTEVNQIIETNTGTVIGKGIQHNYATNPELAEALAEFKQTIVDLQQKYPQATDAQIPAIVDVEFQEIKRTQPQRWQNFLNLKRQWNGVKKGLLKVGEHFAEETPWGKGVIGYLEGVTDEVK